MKKGRRIISAIILLAMIVSMIPVIPRAAEEFKQGDVTYEVGTDFATYGPKNEVYLTKGQAVVIKVDPKNTYYVGMKTISSGTAAQVNVSGLSMKDPQTITVSHSTDMYYGVTPISGENHYEAYIVIQNVSQDGARLALTKLRTTNMHADPEGNGVQMVQAQEAVSTMSLFEDRLEEAKNASDSQPETPDDTGTQSVTEKNEQLAEQLFTEARSWLQDEAGGAV